MGIILKGFGVVICLFILMVLFSTLCFGMDTRTAYTRDGENFISKKRVDENIQAGISKPGEYREVQVPINTFVLGGFMENTTYDKNTSKQPESKNAQPFNTTQKAMTSTSINEESKNTHPFNTMQTPLTSTPINENALRLFVVLFFGLILALFGAIKLGYL
jgi:hypothetical protein